MTQPPLVSRNRLPGCNKICRRVNFVSTERRITGFIDPFLILTGGNRPLLQQLAEALAAFTFNNKEVPRLKCAVIRRAGSRHTSAVALLYY